MKKILTILSAAALVAVGYSAHAQVILTGVYDGDASGGQPKGVEIYVGGTIDFTGWEISNFNNGNTTADNTAALDTLGTLTDTFAYITNDTVSGFNTWFGFNPDLADASSPNVNGDDAIAIFDDTATQIDVYGAIGTDGSGEVWEYQDGWAYRSDGTGPGGSTFTPGDWTFANGDFDGFSSNAGATNSMPVGTYVIPEPSTAAFLLSGLAAMLLRRRRA